MLNVNVNVKLRILYLVVSWTLICDLNRYAVGYVQGNKFNCFFVLEKMGSESW